MRRTDFILRVTSFIVFLAIAIYVGYYIYDAYTVPFKTVTAVTYSLENGAETEGYCLRREMVVTEGGAGVSVIVDEGDKVSAGQRIAVDYPTQAAIDKAEKRREIDLRIEQLQALLKVGETDTATSQDSVLSLSKVVNSGSLSDLDIAVSHVEAYIMKGASGASREELESEIRALTAQREQYQSDSGEIAVYAEKPGVFSTYVDGYESITLDDVAEMQAGRIRNLFADGKRQENAIGKIVTDITWYYVTTLSTKDAERLSVGGVANITFSKTYSRTLQMRVERIGEPTNDRCTVVFSTTKYIGEVAAIREMTGRVVFSDVQGIRVPKSAMHLNENGQSYLYVLAGVQAQSAVVDIIGETGDYYVVREDRQSGIREGSEIITKAKDLYDGKVVK